MNPLRTYLLLEILLVASLAIGFASPAVAAEDKEPTLEHEIGTMVLEIQAALKAPGKKESLETIARHGTDSRYYVMIRGWLVQVLKGTESQASAAKDPKLKAKHEAKVAFLKKAIRRLDLE